MPSSLKNLKNTIVKAGSKILNARKFRLIKKGDSGKEVEKLQEALLSLGYLTGNVDGIFGEVTESSVEKFQHDVKILVDGIVGNGTIKEIDKKLVDSGINKTGLFLEQTEKLQEKSKKMRWVKCSADIAPGRGGYSSLTLRQDAAQAFQNLSDDVHGLGGIITTAGGKRSLISKTSRTRSKKSMHYVGLAFDLSLPTAMQNPKTDPYIIQDLGNRRWEVWCRTDDDSVPIRTIEGTFAKSKSNKTVLERKNVKGRFFSFTELAKSHGFYPIRARRSFFKGGSYTGAEWWHFQFEDALVRRKSKFGEELLKLYTAEKCENFLYWSEVKDCTFGVDWF